LELEPAGADCAWGRIGGWAATAGLPAENGYAGLARGGGREFNTLRRIVLHTPTQAELGWGTLGSLDRRDNPGRFQFHELGAVGAGSAGFRC